MGKNSNTVEQIVEQLELVLQELTNCTSPAMLEDVHARFSQIKGRGRPLPKIFDLASTIVAKIEGLQTYFRGSYLPASLAIIGNSDQNLDDQNSAPQAEDELARFKKLAKAQHVYQEILEKRSFLLKSEHYDSAAYLNRMLDKIVAQTDLYIKGNFKLLDLSQNVNNILAEESEEDIKATSKAPEIKELMLRFGAAFAEAASVNDLSKDTSAASAPKSALTEDQTESSEDDLTAEEHARVDELEHFDDLLEELDDEHSDFLDEEGTNPLNIICDTLFNDMESYVKGTIDMTTLTQKLTKTLDEQSEDVKKSSQNDDVKQRLTKMRNALAAAPFVAEATKTLQQPTSEVPPVAAPHELNQNNPQADSDENIAKNPQLDEAYRAFKLVTVFTLLNDLKQKQEELEDRNQMNAAKALNRIAGEIGTLCHSYRRGEINLAELRVSAAPIFSDESQDIVEINNHRGVKTIIAKIAEAISNLLLYLKIAEAPKGRLSLFSIPTATSSLVSELQEGINGINDNLEDVVEGSIVNP